MIARTNPAADIARRLSACERHAILAAIIWAERQQRPAQLSGAARLLFEHCYRANGRALEPVPDGADLLMARHLESYLAAPRRAAA